MAIFNYGPLYGVQIAFKDYKGAPGIAGQPLGGAEALPQLLRQLQFSACCFENTLALSRLYSLAVGFPLPILLALMLNEIRQARLKKAVQTDFLYAPHFISTVVMVGILVTMLSPSIGVVNTLRARLGLERIYFMTQPSSFRHLYVWSGVWQGIGWSAVIYLSALSAVDPELHEAARIDGASRLMRIRHINIPAIQPTVVILFVMSVGQLASVGYEKIYLLQNDLNVNVSEVISTYVYKRGIKNTNYSFSAAVGLFNNVINIVLLLCANAVSHRLSQTSLF